MLNTSLPTGRLGRTDLGVTKIGLGLAALGRPGYINLGHAGDLGREYSVEAMRQHAYAVLDAGWEAGIRYFDAARSYGRAEEFLGGWLAERSIRAEDVTVGSKWGYVYTAGWQVDARVHEVKQHTLEVFERQLGESRASLDGYLCLYQIHSATRESGVLENKAILAALAGCRDEGLAIGLTVSGPGQAGTILQAVGIASGGRPLFDSVQATWNLLEPSAGEALAAAHRAGMGVIVKEALSNGRLTGRNDEPDFAKQKAALQRAAADAGTTIDAFAIAAVLAQPWADIVLSGAAAPEQVASNVGAAGVVWDPAHASELAFLTEPPEDYWARRGRLPWG